jgi:hypothetical protein
MQAGYDDLQASCVVRDSGAGQTWEGVPEPKEAISRAVALLTCVKRMVFFIQRIQTVYCYNIHCWLYVKLVFLRAAIGNSSDRL